MLFYLFRLHDKDEKIRKIKGKKRRGVVAEIKDEKSMLTLFLVFTIKIILMFYMLHKNILGGHLNMKVIKAEVDYESESLANSDSDVTPPPVLKKKYVKV